MATIHTCDHTDHVGEQVEAVALVKLHKTDTKQSNTISTVKMTDTCAKHVGETAQNTFRSGSMDPLFYAVVIESYKKEKS
jgi:hypothetical protein